MKKQAINTENNFVNYLLANGGNRWTKNSYDRVYFNMDTILELLGYEFENYNTGNTCWASLNGEKISNSQFGKIKNSITKFWYDIKTDKFQFFTNTDTGKKLANELAQKLRTFNQNFLVI